jgi:hypothetical protein
MDSNIKKKAGVSPKIKDISDILNLVPPEVIEQFAIETKVDYHAKLLQGSTVFSMLLHILITENKVSQRGARAILLSKLPGLHKTNFCPIKDHSSISHRLAHINIEFFEKLYEEFVKKISPLYQPVELLKLHLCAVDSTIVAETCNKLKAGFKIGNKSAKGGQRKHVKYSEAFDGLVVEGIQFNNDKTKQAENNSLPEVINSAVKRDRYHQNLYIIDKGLSGAKAISELNGTTKDRNKVFFLVRIADNRRIFVRENFEISQKEWTSKDGKIIKIVEFDKVQIYKSASTKPEDDVFCHVKAKIYNSSADVASDKYKIVNLLTNVDGLDAKEMLEAYRYRWTIEVFFKFLKQNLDFSHLISTSVNGLKVMMYMTMIAAMMILLYGRTTKNGFKIAKIQFDYYIKNLTTAMSIVLYGGNAKKYMEENNIKFPKWMKCWIQKIPKTALRSQTSLNEILVHL